VINVLVFSNEVCQAQLLTYYSTGDSLQTSVLMVTG